MMPNKIDVEDMTVALADAAGLFNESLSEYWEQLPNILRTANSCGSEEFFHALEKEIKDQYDYFMEYGKIVEEVKEVKVTRKVIVWAEEEE
jgi:hypothetical protein